MEKKIQTIITGFQQKLQQINATSEDDLLKVNQGIKLCQNTLIKLKNIIADTSFKDMKAEIHFFKCIKLLPMSYLQYYDLVYTCETCMPKMGYKAQKRYLEQKMEGVNSFFTVNAIFVNYARLQCTDLDECYFTRNFMDNATSIENNDIYYDPEFNTLHDVLLAKVKANYMFMEYINKKIGVLDITHLEQSSRRKDRKPLKFDCQIVDAGEVIIACHAAGVFKGNPSLTAICRLFEEAFNIKVSNIHSIKRELKERDGGVSIFLETLIYKLKKYMDDN